MRAAGDGRADAAHAGDSHDPSHQFRVMVRFRRAHRLHLPLVELRHIVFCDAARQAQQQTHRGLRNAGREGARVVRHDDRALAHDFVHALDAGASRLHPLELRRVVEVGAA
ncbi:MAG: hypothetical protein NT090_27075, partial [Acidobacteria bacterium]|nr:hypothetical protein [Acidobacteriota bacterium]